jgi:hypothetical protein
MIEDSVIRERNKVLKKAHEQIIKASHGVGYISRQTIIELIQEQPAPRFYITPYMANLYINNIKHRRSKCRKQEMIKDLIENYNRLKAENPDKPKEWLYEHVVEQPAKSFYMSDRSIKEVIFQYSGRSSK